jgi:hypothetical protein
MVVFSAAPLASVTDSILQPPSNSSLSRSDSNSKVETRPEEKLARPPLSYWQCYLVRKYSRRVAPKDNVAYAGTDCGTEWSRNHESLASRHRASHRCYSRSSAASSQDLARPLHFGTSWEWVESPPTGGTYPPGHILGSERVAPDGGRQPEKNSYESKQ